MQVEAGLNIILALAQIFIHTVLHPRTRECQIIIGVHRPVDPNDYLAFARPGVQHGVYKNLRQGKYDIQSRLDLHRHTVEQARTALYGFVVDCQTRGAVCTGYSW